MGNYEHINATVPFDVQAQCVNLEAFLVPRAFFVHYNFLRSICESCQKLVRINLSELNYLSEEQMKILATCNTLVDINLTGTMISDALIGFLTFKMPQISQLNLRLCKRLSDKSMCCIAANSKNLSRLYLFKKSRFISTNSIQHVINNCPMLQYLEVSTFVIVERRSIKESSKKASLAKCQLKSRIKPGKASESKTVFLNK